MDERRRLRAAAPSGKENRLKEMARPALVVVVLALLTLAVFGPLTRHGFSELDDRAYVVDNPRVTGGLTAGGAAWAFISFANANWHPLTWLSHMADVSLFGLEPAGHHAVSLLLHLANAILLFLALRGISGALWRSALVAALFAWHPLHVESVAWIAERKDVLAGLFFMLTLTVYLRYLRRPGAGRYGAVVLIYALGLAAKPMLVTLPALLLLLDWWPLGRWGPAPRAAMPAGPRMSSRQKEMAAPGLLRLVVEKVPLLVLAAASAVVTWIAQRAGGGVRSLETYPWGVRAANALISYLSYLGKTVWPAGLAFFYPHPQRLPPAWLTAGALLALAGLTVAALASARRIPALAVGWLWYIGTLVPVIGLIQVGAQAMADRYTYLPLIGLFVAVAWGLAEMAGKGRARRLAAVLAAGSALAVLAAASSVQIGYWRDDTTLLRRTLKVTRDNWVADYILGAVLVRQGRLDEGIAAYREAVRIKPGYADARNSLGTALLRQGDPAAALLQIEEARRLNPGEPLLSYNLGVAADAAGDPTMAEAAYRDALALRPDYPEARNNLGAVLVARGRYEEALGQFSEVLRIRPDFEKAHVNAAGVLQRLGRTGEAIAHYREALRLKPDYAAARRGLESALGEQPRQP